jgi:hypothetical protein
MSHWDFYQDLVKGDLDDAESHRKFYDEYNAVLDMPAEYYLDTIRVVFQQHLLPRGVWDVAASAVRTIGDIRKHRADDHRRRTRRHFRPGPDPRRAQVKKKTLCTALRHRRSVRPRASHRTHSAPVTTASSAVALAGARRSIRRSAISSSTDQQLQFQNRQLSPGRVLVELDAD